MPNIIFYTLVHFYFALFCFSSLCKLVIAILYRRTINHIVCHFFLQSVVQMRIWCIYQDIQHICSFTNIQTFKRTAEVASCYLVNIKYSFSSSVDATHKLENYRILWSNRYSYINKEFNVLTFVYSFVVPLWFKSEYGLDRVSIRFGEKSNQCKRMNAYSHLHHP